MFLACLLDLKFAPCLSNEQANSKSGTLAQAMRESRR